MFRSTHATRDEPHPCNSLYDRIRMMVNEQGSDLHRLPPMPVEYAMEVVLNSSNCKSYLNIIHITYFGRRIALLDKHGLRYRWWFHRRRHACIIEPYIQTFLRRLEHNIGHVDGHISNALIPTAIMSMHRTCTTGRPNKEPMKQGQSATIHTLFPKQ